MDRNARDSRARALRDASSPPSHPLERRRPSAPLKNAGRRVLRRRNRTFEGPRGIRLLSLMARIVVRPALPIGITLSLSLSAGCAGLLGSPYDRANGYVSEANGAIDEHNRLFENARDTYDEAKQSVEAGESTSGESTSGEATSQRAERIARAREDMQEARDKLEEAREALSEVQDLEVEDEIKEYTGLLTEAVDAQLAAEDEEIRFYELLEEDPRLSENRDDAEALLTEVGDGYQEARDAYDRAQEVADVNPDLLPDENGASR